MIDPHCGSRQVAKHAKKTIDMTFLISPSRQARQARQETNKHDIFALAKPPSTPRNQ